MNPWQTGHSQESAASLLLDACVIPLLLLWLAFDPNFAHGWVDYLELGQYLGPIDGVFRGDVVYRDNISLYGPLSIYLPAFFLKLCGPTIWSLRLFFHISSIVTVLTTYVASFSVCNRRLWRIAAPLLCLIEAQHPFWSTHASALRVAIALLALVAMGRFLRRRMTRDAVMAGAVSGVGLLYSTDTGITVAITAIALMLLMLLQYKSTDGLLRGVGGYSLGLLVGCLPWLIYAGLSHALGSYLRVALWEIPAHHLQIWGHGDVPSLTLAYHAAPSFLDFIRSHVVKAYAPAVFYSAALGAVAYRLYTRRLTDEETSRFCPFLIYGALQYGLSFRSIWGPQFQMALPPLFLCLAFVWERSLDYACATWRSPEHSRMATSLAVGSVVFLLLSAAYVAASPKRFYSTLGGWFFYQQEKPGYWAYYDNPLTLDSIDLVDPDCARCGAIAVPLQQAIDLYGASTFLSQNTSPSEAVFAFPEQGIFTFLADRPHLSRFDIAGLAWGHPSWTVELVNALQNGRPRFVVAGRPPSNLARSIGRTQEILPEVVAYLTKHYRILRRYGTIDILVRDDLSR